MTVPIYLASQSPRRRALLKQLGLDVQLLLPSPDEDAESLELPIEAESPLAYVERVTHLKLVAAMARRQARSLEPGVILCADTTVALDGRLFGKPLTNDEASAMLGELSDRWHDVHTAIAMSNGSSVRTCVASSRIQFKALTPEDIAAYVATGEPFGKAGAYALQGTAAQFVRRLEGTPSGVIGLPLYETAQLCNAFGIATIAQPRDDHE